MITTAEKIAVMQAFERGEKVECREFRDEGWFVSDDPTWEWGSCEYRVAPKPIDLVEVLEFCSGYMHRGFNDGSGGR